MYIVHILCCVSVLSHAEEVEAGVDPTGDEDHEDGHEIEVARGCQHHGKSLNNTLLTVRSYLYFLPRAWWLYPGPRLSYCIGKLRCSLFSWKKKSSLDFFKKSYLPVFKLILSHPQLLLLLSIEVDLNIAVGNKWNKAVAEESYAESEEKDKLRVSSTYRPCLTELSSRGSSRCPARSC